MLNKIYYKSDNILNGIILHPSFNEIFESTTITDTTDINGDRVFTMSYEPFYPTIMDADIVDSSNVVVGEDYVQFLPDTTTILDVILSDEYMKLCCDTLCSEDYKFKLNSFIFSIFKANRFSNPEIFFNTSKNQFTDNTIIYDYILNPLYGKTIYSSKKLDLIPKRELIGYVDESDLPEYTIKCINDQGVVTYYNIHLHDLEYTQNTGIVTSTFYDIETLSDTTLSDSMLHSCKTISILLDTDAFKMYFKSLRELNVSVHLLIKIKNLTTDQSIFIRKDTFYFNWYRGCIFYYTLDITKLNIMVDYSHWFLTRGLYLSYNSSDIVSLIKDTNNIIFNINDIVMAPTDPEVEKTLLESDNYLVQNNLINYIPLGLHKSNDGGNVFSITIKDLVNKTTAKLYDDMYMSLMRNLVPHKTTFPSFSPTNTSIILDNNKYFHASSRWEINNTIHQYDNIVTSKFNSLNNSAIGINISDITSILDEMDQDLKVHVFLRKISTLQSYIYIQFKKDEDFNYLKRFLNTNVVDLILENIILSITTVDNRNNNLILKMLKPSSEVINRYSDELGTETYMYIIDKTEIVSINGVYNRKVIENNYADQYLDSTVYYVPKDVVIISNNKT